MFTQRKTTTRNKLTILFGIVLLTLSSCGKTSTKYDIVNHEYYLSKVADFEAENETLIGQPIDCIFIGDSWTDGYRPLETYYPDITVLNRGIGGDNSYGLLQRLDVSVNQLTPKVVVMLIGGNNLNDCDEDIEDIILNMKENTPDTKIIMQSMYSIANEAWLDKIPRLLELNASFESLCEQYDLTYVDVYSHLVDEEGTAIPEYHVEDGVHMSELGYLKITEVLKPVILSF